MTGNAQESPFERRRRAIADLKACSITRNLAGGRDIHTSTIQKGDASNIHVASTLISMYAKCGSMDDALGVFRSMKHPNVVAWTALITGYADNGNSQNALDLLSEMRQRGCSPDARAFLGLVKASLKLGVNKGKMLHLLALESGYYSDLHVQNTLVFTYAKCGDMVSAQNVFNCVRHPDIVSWNALILGYVENGEAGLALDLLWQMRQRGCSPDARTLLSALKALGDDRERGKELHLLALESDCGLDIYLQAALVHMYAKCGCMNDASKVFESLRHPDVVCWNTLILGYADSGEGWTALYVFSQMARQACQPDERTFVAALKACTILEEKVASMKRGRAVHQLACRSGWATSIYVQNTLVDMYAKSGNMEDAQRVFDRIKKPVVVSWSALVLGYAANGDGKTALELFLRMLSVGCLPNSYSFVAGLKACGMIGAVETGKACHAHIRRCSLESNELLVNCLMDFYAKCGNLHELEQVFAALRFQPRLKSWNTLMAGYCRHGDTGAVFGIFGRMQASGVQPDSATFNYILSACSHAGLVEKASEYFEAMASKYGLHPDAEHHNCMIDMLARSNKLEDAMRLLRGMPFCPSVVAWMSLLAACHKWKLAELGRLAFQCLVALQCENARAYVLMANICLEQTLMDRSTDRMTNFN